MNQGPKSTAKVNGTPIDFYQGHFHLGFPFKSQTLIIELFYYQMLMLVRFKLETHFHNLLSPQFLHLTFPSTHLILTFKVLV
jgi:hypothetical protein